MDTFTIKRLLKTYKCFKGVYPSDKLPYNKKFPLNIIVNTDPSDRPGQHWVAISITRSGCGYYFDSFGRQPTVPSIIAFLRRKCKTRFSYNTQQLQNVTSSTCGNYCVLFTIFRCNNMRPQTYLKYFVRSSEENDRNMLRVFKNFALVRVLFPAGPLRRRRRHNGYRQQ
jgi:hypothetical protein